MALFSNNISRLFENNPVNQVGPTGQPLIGGSNITDLGARSLGGLLGREVRGRPEQLSAALSQIDPKAPDAQQQQLAILIELGNPQQQVMAAQKLRQLGESEKTKAQTQRFRTSLISRNEALGGSENRTATIADATPDMLLDIRKEILDEERAAAIKNNGKQGRFAIGQAAGLSKEQVGQYSNLSDEAFAKVISAQEADDVMMKDSSGNMQTYRMNKFGMVSSEDPKTGVAKWVTANSLGLLEAPKETKTLNQASELSSELTKAGVTSFVDLTDQARTANSTLATNEEGRKILDAGVFTGSLLAAPVNELLLVAKSFGFEGESIDDAENAQRFMATRVVEIGNAIKMFGSGTGLSDKDAELAASAAAGKMALTEENIRELMRIADVSARKKLDIHNTVYREYAKTASPSSLAAFRVDPFSSSSQPPLSPTAQQYIK